jgi:hypothetical protein
MFTLMPGLHFLTLINSFKKLTHVSPCFASFSAPMFLSLLISSTSSVQVMTLILAKLICLESDQELHVPLGKRAVYFEMRD